MIESVQEALMRNTWTEIPMLLSSSHCIKYKLPVARALEMWALPLHPAAFISLRYIYRTKLIAIHMSTTYR